MKKNKRQRKKKGILAFVAVLLALGAVGTYLLVFQRAFDSVTSGIFPARGAQNSSSSSSPKNNKPDTNRLVAEMIPVLRQEIKSGSYEKAYTEAQELLKKKPDDPELLNIISSSQDIVEYTGIVEHIFFHPLIAYPNRAFKHEGQDLYMVTVPEFKRILEQVYARNYILVDLMDIYRVEYDSAGAVVSVAANKLMLPQGKKPLVISIDDVNYYKYMIEQGQVFKLVLDKKGDIETYSLDEKGNEVYSKDNEIIPILDDFVRRNPDFSFNGAKGTLNLTGYEGVLGYRTNSIRYENYQSEREEAKKVVKRLKETGWSFASHSQGHRHFAKVSYNAIVEDTDRYIVEVESLVGKTPLFVYPYGEQVSPSDPKFKYLQQKGFGVFCGVSKIPGSKLGEGYIIMNRRNVDGIALKDNRNHELYDAKTVTDPVRPWYHKFYGASNASGGAA